MILSFTCGERERGGKKTAQIAAKWILRIKFLTDDVSWQLGSFFDLAVQVLGWWVTTTAPVTRETLNPSRWVLREVLEVNIAPL